MVAISPAQQLHNVMDSVIDPIIGSRKNISNGSVRSARSVGGCLYSRVPTETLRQSGAHFDFEELAF